MLLLDDFYTIKQQEQTDDKINSSIVLNINHDIYKGHFPQQPVVPGVCMMQMVAETTSKILDKKLSLQKGSQAKFLIPIVPDKNPKLTIQTKYSLSEDGEVKVNSSITDGELTFFKFKGVLA